MSRRLALYLLLGAFASGGCDELEINESAPPQPSSEKASKRDSKLSQPARPIIVPYGEVFEQAPIPQEATPSDKETLSVLKELRQQGGGGPALLGKGDWSPQAQEALEAAEEIRMEGNNTLGPLVEKLADAKEELLATEDFSSDVGQNRIRAARVAQAEMHLAMLVLKLADQMGATRPTPPETRRHTKKRLLEAYRKFPEVLSTLEPPDADYWKLQKAKQKYEKLAKRGGFTPLPKGVTKLKPGMQSPMIAQLRKRLAEEDPKFDPEGDTWDDAMTESLNRFRVAHQLKAYPKKRAHKLMDKKLRKALSVPAEERVKTLKKNIERWRKSPIRDHHYKVVVILPEYHGEVWEGKDRIHRFKVIIGSHRKRRGRRINATPEVSSAIQTVVFNPYWNVPKRILKQELLPMAERKSLESEEGLTPEEILEKKGYEFRRRHPTRPIVRMKPGPRNALGRVKFIFENRHFVFLHDTPGKRKFRAIHRAFSHGCIRVHQPMTLAELLLRKDGTWHLVEKKKVRKHYRETPITLNSPIPIILAYFTARVGDEGLVHWFKDVYQKDREPSRAL